MCYAKCTVHVPCADSLAGAQVALLSWGDEWYRATRKIAIARGYKDADNLPTERNELDDQTQRTLHEQVRAA